MRVDSLAGQVECPFEQPGGLVQLAAELFGVSVFPGLFGGPAGEAGALHGVRRLEEERARPGAADHVLEAASAPGAAPRQRGLQQLDEAGVRVAALQQAGVRLGAAGEIALHLEVAAHQARIREADGEYGRALELAVLLEDAQRLPHLRQAVFAEHAAGVVVVGLVYGEIGGPRGAREVGHAVVEVADRPVPRLPSLEPGVSHPIQEALHARALGRHQQAVHVVLHAERDVLAEAGAERGEPVEARQREAEVVVDERSDAEVRGKHPAKYGVHLLCDGRQQHLDVRSAQPLQQPTLGEQLVDEVEELDVGLQLPLRPALPVVLAGPRPLFQLLQRRRRLDAVLLVESPPAPLVAGRFGPELGRADLDEVDLRVRLQVRPDDLLRELGQHRIVDVL